MKRFVCTEADEEYVQKPKEFEDSDVIITGEGIYLGFKLKDGTIKKMIIDDYILFIVQYQHSPKECTNSEFIRKTLHMAL